VGIWRRRALIALGIFCALLLLFHRPLLLYVGRKTALHYAAKENLKLEFRLEGSVFTNLTVRNLHAAPTGPSDVEPIDVDLARVDYGIASVESVTRSSNHGLSEFAGGIVFETLIDAFKFSQWPSGNWIVSADATYSPEGLDAPTIFLRSDKMYFQAIAQAKGDTFEISKIELDQEQAKYAGGLWRAPGRDVL